MSDDRESPVSIEGQTLVVEVPVLDELQLVRLETRLESTLSAMTELLGEARRMLIAIRRARRKFGGPHAPPPSPPHLRSVGPREPRKKRT